MRSCFIGLLHPLIVRTEPENGETASAAHLPLQLLHLCLDYQVNRFMGCDCHIEGLIKREKSLLAAAQVRAKGGSPLALVYLRGKLLFALLIERRAMARVGNDWTQMLTVRVATWWRFWKLIAQEVREAVLDTGRWSEWEWRAVLRALAERPRHRKLQTVPSAVTEWLQFTPLAPLREAA